MTPPITSNYSLHATEILRSSIFKAWLADLRDRRAVQRIAARIDRLAGGNPGDVKPVGSGLSELRIDYCPGSRFYFMRRGTVVIVLLCGGTKSSQERDIQQAKALAELWKDTP